MKTIFKKGDRVFDKAYGWGTVYEIENYDRYAVRVIFDDNCKYSYTLEGFSQERPEELPKKGQIVWIRGKFPSKWEIGHFFEKKGDEYRTCLSPSYQGWSNKGIEITTTNPYKDEN